ncbi:Iron-sulfur cluster assembly protein SufD [hydrothermal vent metagenome]|uniref:Iron-sulfur cluster assembly protein SufD n=1 Tax=hydrothermal vent metagenome TaxID=652676 RepID=A0A3B0RXD2_9ZZZZ
MNQMATSTAMTALSDAFLAQAPDAAQKADFARFAAIGLPHPRAENWRWTDLHGSFRKALANEAEASSSQTSLSLTGDFVGSCAVENQQSEPMILLANGLANAASREGFVVHGSPDEPLVLQSKNQQRLAGSNVQIRIKAGVHAVLVENNHRAAQSLSVDFRDIIIEAGASLIRVLLCPNQPQQTRINHTCIEVGKGSSYQQFTLDFGAQLSRIETHINYVGENANVLLNGAYLLDGEARADSTSQVRHALPNCTTRQLLKGVVRDTAQAVFQGKFYVSRAGQKTDAKMGHHTLLLSENARVHAKPELEIYADDVACAHGNTTGRLDEAALFYMRQRGLSEPQARALLIRAFVGEVLDAAPTFVRETLGDKMDIWLEQGE